MVDQLTYGPVVNITYNTSILMFASYKEQCSMHCRHFVQTDKSTYLHVTVVVVVAFFFFRRSHLVHFTCWLSSILG